MSVYLSNQPDPAAVAAALAKEVVPTILLLELRFASGTVHLTNQVVPFTDTEWGQTWQGCGTLVGMTNLRGGPNDLAPLREYTLGIPWEVLSDAERGSNGLGRIPGLIGDPADYRGRPAILWEQILDADTRDPYGRMTPVGIPSALDFSRMDTVKARYSATAAVLTLSCEAITSRKASATYGRLTPRDQYRRTAAGQATDKGLDHVPEVMNTTPEWTRF